MKFKPCDKCGSHHLHKKPFTSTIFVGKWFCGYCGGRLEKKPC